MPRFWFFIVAISAAALCAQIARADDAKAASAVPQKGDTASAVSSQIAVYDIDKVAHDMGWTTDMKLNLEGLQKEFESELKRSQQMYSQQIADQKRHWAPEESDKLTPEQQDTLLKMNSFANQVLSALSQKGSQELVNYRQQWVVQYRRALRPVLKQVAEDKKLAIIFEINDTVQYFQPSLDITDAIINAARANPPVVTPVPMPTLPSAAPMELKAPSTQPTSQPSGAESGKP
jgi:hypothetical protein